MSQNQKKKEKGSGRGHGSNMGSRPNSANDLRSRGQNSTGGGRGIPDYKDGNPVRRSASSAQQEQQDGRFDSAEANKWMQSRYNAISEEIDKYKRERKSGGASPNNSPDVIVFGDTGPSSAWTRQKPFLPGKNDFLEQVQQGLQNLRP